MTEHIRPEFSHQHLATLLMQHYGLQGELTDLPGYSDQNLRCQGLNTYIVKIANSAESLLELDMQNAVMAHLHQKCLPAPKALPNHQGQMRTSITDENGQDFQLRVLTYLAGDFYADASAEAQGAPLWQSLGQFLGELDVALSDFSHPGSYRTFDWDLAQGYRVCQAKKHLLDEEQALLVEHFSVQYQSQVAATLPLLPQGVIHSDANDYNLLIDNKLAPEAVTGIIDFGDVVHSHVINELAIACAYAVLNQADVLGVICQVAANYHQKRPLDNNEFKVLFNLIALRLCTTVCNAAKAIAAEPDNEYLLVSVTPAWRALHALRKISPLAATAQIRLACGVESNHGRDAENIVQSRQQHLSKALSLSYQAPLKIVSGQGAYLFDEQGNKYLDMINNVCHVGHCHPHVVAAGQQQMAQLNTNTRFLHDNLVDYAERLLATFPEQLSVCMLVNSGSEANELAMRLAQNYTGSDQLIVVEGAYHGNTAACINASPYKFNGPGGKGKPDHVHMVPLPDPYRGVYQGNDEEIAEQYAQHVAEQVEHIQQQEQVGAFICESLQGVAGQVIMPDGYLQHAYQHVRNAGGVCIADEVQVGFGRVGSHMWAFETQGVVPDIVSLGKPIGNGHPMAAVITTRAIADAFVNGMEYFNTFGGNPVSCAIGNAVLDVIDAQNLRQHAQSLGEYMLEQLRALQQRHALIGDVRGKGLFIGVELVTDRQSKAPATEQMAELIEHFKSRHILLSSEGPGYNILKIKPPMTFDQADADNFLQVLDEGLRKIPTKA